MRHCCAALLVVALGPTSTFAQGSSSGATSGPQTQLSGSFVAGKRHGQRWYGEIDVEPKWQVTGERWRSFTATPAAEHYPADWLDLVAETAVGNTLQRDGLDTFEVTPRVGVRFHLFAKMAPYRPDVGGLRERLPLTRVALSTLVRVEWRNLFYSDATPDQHQWRARLQLQGKLALNRAKLSADRTLYAVADGEYYMPFGEDVPERYVSKVRARLGVAFRFSAATKVELRYIRDWNRRAPDAAAAEDTQGVDLQLKLLF